MIIQLLHTGKKLLLLLSIMVMMEASAEESKAKPQPFIKDLGNNQYQVGQIVIDKSKGQFRVPGKVIRTELFLEFLAVTKGGFKAYESMLELEVNAFEFNLACILIGLDNENVKPAKFHFDAKPVEGDRVELQIEWRQKGATVFVSAAELLVEGEKDPKHPQSDWIYLGSTFYPDGKYMAEVDGVLVGFVHSPASVIEHRTGVGLGNYGAVGVSKKVPPLDTPVVLIVKKSRK